MVKRQRHGAFGTITQDPPPSLDFRFSFTGRVWDADAELYYYRACWYDADVGKFVSDVGCMQ